VGPSKEKLGFRSIQRLVISDVAGSVVVATWPAELAVQARYLYGGGLGSALVAAAIERGWTVEPSPHIAYYSASPGRRLYMRPSVAPLRCPAADEFASRRQGGVLAASGVLIADDGHLLDIHGEQVKSPGLRIRAERCCHRDRDRVARLNTEVVPGDRPAADLGFSLPAVRASDRAVHQDPRSRCRRRGQVRGQVLAALPLDAMRVPRPYR